MKISPRETVLGLATLFVVLYGFTLILAKPKLDEYQELNFNQEQLQNDIDDYQALIDQRARWESKFNELKQLLPEYPAGQKMDIHWLTIMDKLAQKHGISISKRQAGEEEKAGDVYELPIECQRWEGSLKSITHFLFELQEEGAMLDTRQLMISPSSNASLTLTSRTSSVSLLKPFSSSGILLLLI